MTVPRSHFISSVFQEFYEEVLRQKEKALRESESGSVTFEGVSSSGSKDFPPALGDSSPGSSIKDDGVIGGEGVEQEEIETVQRFPSFEETKGQQGSVTLCQGIQRKLRLFLEEESLKASYQLGEYAQSNFREAQYLMAALVDEIFLNLQWPGKKQWRKHLLETQLFQTQVAGELFFSRLELLLEAADPTRNELATIYLLCLSLGFRGKYRDMDDEGKIDFYKKQLYHLINNKESDLYGLGRKYLTHAVYEHTIALPLSRGLPDVRSWLITFVGIAFTYLFITYIVWYKLVRDLDEALQFIFDQARSLPL